jgi:hypothetical protein
MKMGSNAHEASVPIVALMVENYKSLPWMMHEYSLPLAASKHRYRGSYAQQGGSFFLE